MRKMRHRVKSFTAMLLSACLVLSQGAVNVWAAEAVPEEAAVEAAVEEAAAEEATAEEAVAEEAAEEEIAAAEEIVAEEAVAEEAAVEEITAEEITAEEAAVEETAADAGPGTASSSDAEKETETTEASPTKDKATDSDAMYDEDGLLLDGKVADDVTVEVEEELIEAPETKTEVIAPEQAGDEWYTDYDYTVNHTNRTITLRRYEGTDASVFVEDTATISGREYTVLIAPSQNGEGLFYDNAYVEDITFEHVSFPADCSGMFRYCTSLENVDMYWADLSSVTTMKEMFANCSSLTGVGFGNQATSKLKNMSYMFDSCSSLGGVDFSTIDTKNVTDMSFMFVDCTALNDLYLNNHFTDSVQNFSGMFEDCSHLSYFSFNEFNMSKATNISGMFEYCSNLTSMDFRNVNLSRVQAMDALFAGCDSITEIYMTGVDLGAVTSAYGVFSGCTALNHIYSPRNLHFNVELPCTMYDKEGNSYDSLPMNVGYSVNIADNQSYVLVTEVKVNVSARTIAVGETFQMAAWPQPTNATNKEITWLSNDSDIVTVNSNGLVTGKAPGKAQIIAESKDGLVRGFCMFTVGGVPVTSVKINTTARTMEKGSTFQLKAWPQPTNASNKAVTWSSSDPAVASVDEDGLVTALKSGTAKITVKTQDHGHTASCTITVRTPVTGVNINVSSGQKTIEAGKTFQLAAWPQPSDATDKAVTWTSSNTAVATVSSTGLVTAIKNGTANITVKTHDGGFTKVCKITVGVPVTSVKINATSRTLAAGKTFQMAAWPQPTNASNKTVTWTSSNPAVAKVSSTGVVTGVSGGTAVITVKTNDGGKTATCTFTVFVPVTGVKINAKERTIVEGEAGWFQLKAWPQPSNATNKEVTWTSSNPAVATVNATGIVQAYNKGTTVITVQTVDGGYKETCTITVGIPVTSVKINTTAKTISKGATFQLAAWPQPTNASNKKVTWSSSNPAVATVSSTGLVKGIKAGTAVITVKTNDGGKTAKCTITVQ